MEQSWEHDGKEIGALGDKVAGLAERVLAIRTTDDGLPRLELASDGLDLAGKLALEKAVKAAARATGLGDVGIYFKRRTSATNGEPAPRKAKAPFGLTIDKRAIPGVTEVLVVASGKGGVGKSTVSTNLAVALAQTGAKVGLLDADIYGPSAPLMMGVDGPLPVVGEGRIAPLEAHGVKVVSFGFLTDTRQPVIWRGPLVAKALKQLCYDVQWGELDYLVIDLPPGTGDVQLALIESIPIHGALIVTTPQDVALLDAHKALSMFEALHVPVLGVVENMAYFACPCCGHAENVFGEGGGESFAASRKTKLLARIPLNARVRKQGDAGRPVVLEGPEALAEPFKALAGLVSSPQKHVLT